MNKSEARLIALDNRRKNDQSRASSIVLDALISSNILDKYNNIGIYYPIGREIDIMPLVDKYNNKRFYLPITRENISFIIYNKDSKLVKGPFHTMEPVGEVVNRDLIDCFIIPCVGIANDNRRIGYGKGYYDRYLEGYSGLKIGIVYEDAIFDIDGDSFDIKLDLIIKG